MTGVPAPRITREELKQRIDSGAALVIIDARLEYPFEHSTVKLAGNLPVETRQAPKQTAPEPGALKS
jgi:hypothetical protein